MEMIGEKIRRLRKIKEKTQKELGDFLDCSEAQISHIENGNRKVNISDIQKIASFFGVSYDYFFSQQSDSINFRSDNKNGIVDIDEELISDFKRFAINELHERNKRKR